MTRWFRIPLTAAIVVAVVLLVAMAAGGANSTVFERYFPILLIVTSFATIALLAFIGAVVYRLFKQRRNKVFGSRMTINLALYLSLAAVFPCLLLYFVSSQFIGRSIDSWFDVRVEQALDSGVALSSEVLTREQHQLLQTARRIASILNATSKGERALTLDRMRETSDAASAIVFSSSGEILLSSFSPTVTAIIDRPTASQLQKARAEYGIYLLEGEQPESEGSLRIRSIVPMDAYAALQPTTYLQLTQVCPRPWPSTPLISLKAIETIRNSCFRVRRFATSTRSRSRSRCCWPFWSPLPSRSCLPAPPQLPCFSWHEARERWLKATCARLRNIPAIAKSTCSPNPSTP